MRLLVVTDWSLGDKALLATLERVCALGAGVGVQHRNPGAATRRFLAQARALAELSARFGNPFFVNARLDVALIVGAHLHLPVDAPTPADVRPHLPPDRWVSAAVHNESELHRAHGADLFLLSPVFAPSSKPRDERPTLGPSGYARLRQLAAGRPALALGGMDVARLRALGTVDAVAVQSAVLRAPDARAAAEGLLAAFPRL